MTFRKRIFWLLIGFLLSFSAAVIWQANTQRISQRYAQLAERAQVAVNTGIAQVENTLDSLGPLINKLSVRQLAISIKGNRHDITYILFDHNQPLFWSGNKVWPDTASLKNIRDGSLIRLGNGWYYAGVRKSGDRTLVGFLLLRLQYTLQNQYLTDHFNTTLGLPLNSELLSKAAPGTWAITDTHNRYVFSIRFTGQDDQSYPRSIAWLYGISFFLIFLLCIDVLIRMAKAHQWSGLIVLIVLSALRFLILELRIPVPLYESEFFSPRHYASGYLLNSPGDLLLSVAVLFAWMIFSYTWFNYTSLKKEENKYLIPRSLAVAIIFLFTFLFSVFINFLLSGLIINSQISFNTSNVFELDWYSLAGMVVSGILLLSLYLLCDAAIRYIRRTGFRLSHAIILFLTSQGIFLFMLLMLRDTALFHDYGVSAFLFTNSIVVFVSYIRGTDRRLFSFSRTVLVLIGFSLYAGQMIDSFNRIREREKRQLLAAKLENEQDLVAEFLFDGVQARLRNDYALNRFLVNGLKDIQDNPSLREETDRRLMRQYFGGYFNRYDIHFRYFNASDQPVNDAGDPSWNLDSYKARIRKEGRLTACDNLWFIPEGSGRISYLSMIIPVDDTVTGSLVIEMNARYLQDESGLPALLLGNRPDPQEELSNYSFARYQQGRLVGQAGNFNYYLTPAPYEQYFKGLTGMRFIDFDGYSHLFYRFGNDALIIISMPKQGVLAFVTLFSYIFSFFSLGFVFLYLFRRWLHYGFRFGMNFKTRIQVTVMSIVIATLMLTGLATITYIINNYRQAQNLRIRERINNIIVLISNETASRDAFGNTIGDDLNYTLTQLASTLNTDFNIYNPQGILLFTSQPRIYDHELLAPLMDREALTRLTANQKAVYIQPERIGNLNYLAAYEHIRNSGNKTIGYVALPYFARESELNKDISGFLVALINIYVLLFSIAVLLTFVISNRITQPLRIIQDSLRKTKFGRVSEPISWDRKDEIGALVQEYNRMIDELQRSAALLAKSERESAWREMAKQVAHEIKNPLTPMRLSIQHLQRAWEDNYPGREEMVTRISATLIEQIDTLSNIATEFSNFAKMPRPEYLPVDLGSVLEHVTDLFSGADLKVQLNKPAQQMIILADKDQLVRIFSNLLKNAVQSIPDDREGIIRIEVTEEFNAWLVAVKDNGCGIPKDLIERIFTPNFTTKSSGTGLGLAMVRNMLSAMSGEIWFTTVEQKGTSFFVRLNK